MGLNQQFLVPYTVNISWNKAPLCCLHRRTIKALFVNNQAHQYLLSLRVGHGNSVAFLFIVRELVSSNVTASSGWNVFIHNFGSVMCQRSKPRPGVRAFCRVQKWMRCRHGRCWTILGQAPRSLVSISYCPSVLHASFMHFGALHCGWSQKFENDFRKELMTIVKHFWYDLYSCR